VLVQVQIEEAEYMNQMVEKEDVCVCAFTAHNVDVCVCAFTAHK